MTEREPKKIFICATCFGEFDSLEAMQRHWDEIRRGRDKRMQEEKEATAWA